MTDIDGAPARFYADLPSRQANAFPPETKVSVRVDPADLKAFSAE